MSDAECHDEWMDGILVADVDWSRADNVAQFARVESGDQFAFAAESRDELLDVADHLSRFHVTLHNEMQYLVDW